MSKTPSIPSARAILEAKVAKMRGEILNPSCKISLPNEGIWTDDHLKTLVARIEVPMIPKDEEKKILTRFYKFYLTGDLAEGDNTTATILDPIFILSNGPERIFRENTRSTTGRWYSANKSTPLLNNEVVIPKMVPQEYPPGMTEREKQEYDLLLHQYSAESPSLMREFITRGLEDTCSEDFTLLKTLAAALCLVSLRSVTKDKVSVHNAYAKSQFRKNMSHLIQFDPSYPFSPPAKRFVQQVVENFSNSGTASRYTFALIVNEYVDTTREMNGPLVYKALFAATLLTHTSRVGIGMISLLAHVVAMNETAWHEVIGYTLYDCTIKAWSAIYDYLEVSHQKGKEVASAAWARLMSETHNKGLAPKDNLHLATIFAACAERVIGRGIWTAEWSKLIDESYDDLKRVGHALDEHFRPTMKDFNPSPGFEGVVENAKEMKRAGKGLREAREKLGLQVDTAPHLSEEEDSSDTDEEVDKYV